MVKKLETGLTAKFIALPLLTPSRILIADVRMEQVGVERPMSWKTLLAYITGTVDQELLLRNAYLLTENRILRDHIKGRLRWHDGERKALADIGQKLGKQALAEVAKIVKPDTILSWQRRFVAQKFADSTGFRGKMSSG